MPARAATGVNRQINYQAKLLDVSGSPVTDGTYAIKFSLYDSASGGTRLWSASGTIAVPVAMNVSVVNGLFSLPLGDTSLTGGSQNPLNNAVNWNSDSLYLGVTVGADSEMTPRKRLTAAPQAFNAEQIQGMYASGTAYGANSLFVLNQTSNTAATGTRSVLDVRSMGTSDVNDYLIRAINDTGASVFTINRAGSVTSSGSIMPSSDLLVSLGSLTSRWLNGFFGNVSSTNATSTNLYATNGTIAALTSTNSTTTGALYAGSLTTPVFNASNITWTNATGSHTTTTDFAYTNASGTTLRTGSLAVTGSATSTFNWGGSFLGNLLVGTSTYGGGLNPLFSLSGDDLFVNGNIGSATSVYTNGEFVVGSGTTRYGNGYISNSNNALSFYSATSDAVGDSAFVFNNGSFFSSADLFTIMNGPVNSFKIDPNANMFLGLGFGSPMEIDSNGTIKKTGGDIILYPSTGNVVPNVDGAISLGSIGSRFNANLINTTSTNSTSTSLYVNNLNVLNASSTYQRWFNASGSYTTTTNLAVTGNSTSTFSGSLSVNGNVSSSNAIIDNNLAINGRVSTNILPSSDLLVSLGSLTNRWLNGMFGNVSSTNATSTNFYATNGTIAALTFGNATATNFYTTAMHVSSTLDVLPSSAGGMQVVGSTGIGYQPYQTVVRGRYAYTINHGDNDLSIIDIQDPLTPTVATTVHAGFLFPTDIAVEGSYAYVANFNPPGYISILDISNPTSTRLLSTVTGLTSLRAIQANGRYVYGAAATGFYVVDVGNPTAPRLISSVTGGNYYSVSVQGRYAYLAEDSGTLTIMDVQDPYKPVVAGSIALGSFPNSVFVQGRYAYLHTNDHIVIVDVIDAGNPHVVKTFTAISNSTYRTSYVAGRYLYDLGGLFISVYDVLDPPNARYLGNILVGSGIDEAYSMDISGRYLYAAINASDVLKVVDLGGTETNAVIGHAAEFGDLKVVGNARIAEQLSVGGSLNVGSGGILSGGPLAISATNTTSSIMGNLLVGTSTREIAMNSLFRLTGSDLLVGGNIGSASSVYTNGAFIAGPGSTYFGDGFINKTNGNLTLGASGGYILPAADQIVSLGSIGMRFNADLGNVTSTYATTTKLATTNFSLVNAFDHLLQASSTIASKSQTGSGGTSPIDVAVKDKYAFVLNQAGASSALSVVDVSSPSAPNVIKIITLSGTGANKVFVSGKYAYVTVAGNNAMDIIDISDVGNSHLISTTVDATYLNSAYGIYVNGSTAYISTNAGGTDYVSAYDVTDPYHPMRKSSYSGLNNGQEIVVNGRFLYVVDRTGGKLRIFDLTNPWILASPAVVTLNDSPSRLSVQDGYAFVGHAGKNVIQVVNVQDFNSAGVVYTITISGGVTYTRQNGVLANGRYLYALLTDKTLVIYDISNPASPSLTPINTVSTLGTDLNGIIISGRYAYIGRYGDNKLQISDISGIETNGLVAQTAELGDLRVLNNGLIANRLDIGGVLNVANGINSQGPVNVNASTTSATVNMVNVGSEQQGTTWGAYINRLLVGVSSTVEGTNDYSMRINYDGSPSNGNSGLCLDDVYTAGTCPLNAAVSIEADNAINASAFDLAEMYSVSGAVEAGDVLVMDPTTSSTARKSAGVVYDNKIMGVASTRPGFLLGWNSGVAVALAGRVPTKFSPQNGPINIGDPLTSSPYPGLAMKATKPGMIIGRALEAVSVTSTVEAFIHVGYYAGSVLASDGSITTFNDNLVMSPQALADAGHPTENSWGLTFRGSAWDGAQAVNSDFILANTVTSATSSAFTIKDASSTTLLALNQNGTLTVKNDLVVGGKIYPSARGHLQTDKYIYLDDSAAPSSTYMATNADGWQANSSYDFAERYYSPDLLEPGDLVVVSERGQIHVQRSLDDKQMLMGIVSTKPGFVAGAPATSTYPIALVGRVPTKVSTIKGAIKSGDLLTASTIPGVAVKATAAGPIVGQALEDYAVGDVGKIEVFVNPVWWGGDQVAQPAPTIINNFAPTSTDSLSIRGFAVIASGSAKVHVSFTSINAYPNVQVTPRGEVEGGWWTDGYSDTGFDIYMKQVQPRDITFAWRVEATGSGEKVYNSDGTFATLNATTGEVVFGTESGNKTTTTTTPVIPISITTTEPIAETTSTTISTTSTAPVTEIIYTTSTP